MREFAGKIFFLNFDKRILKFVQKNYLFPVQSIKVGKVVSVRGSIADFELLVVVSIRPGGHQLGTRTSCSRNRNKMVASW